MQGIFQKENTDKSLKYGIYRHLPTYEKIIRNLVSFYSIKNNTPTGVIFYLYLVCGVLRWKEYHHVCFPFFLGAILDRLH